MSSIEKHSIALLRAINYFFVVFFCQVGRINNAEYKTLVKRVFESIVKLNYIFRITNIYHVFQ